MTGSELRLDFLIKAPEGRIFSNIKQDEPLWSLS